MALPSKFHIQGLLPSFLNGYFEGGYGYYYSLANGAVWVDYWSAGNWTVWYWDGNDTVSMFVNTGGDEDNFPLSGWEADNGSFDNGGMIITDYSDIPPYKPARLQVQGFDGTGDGVYYSTWSGYVRLGGGVSVLYKNDAWVFENTNGQALASCPGNPWVFPLSGWSPAVLITESVGKVTISTVYELQGIQLAGFMDLEYVQTQAIDASPTNPGSGSYDSSVWTSAGFTPIGTSSKQFVGRYDGQGFQITGLYINRNTLTGCGLFGWLSAYGYNHLPRQIKNTHLRNAYVRGNSATGVLVGHVDADGRIEDCSATGTVIGTNYTAGGLIGTCVVGHVRRCWADVSVSMTGTNRHSAGGFTSGIRYNSTVKDCYARGTVQGGNNDSIGGFAGSIGDEARVERCYATGLATGRNNVGQFSGHTNSETAIVKNCYWVSDDAASTSLHGQRLSGAEAKDKTRYPGWNFQALWNMDPANGINHGYPYLDPRQAPPSELPGLYRSLYRKR